MSNTTQSNEYIKFTDTDGTGFVFLETDSLDVCDQDDAVTRVQVGVLLQWEPPFVIQYKGFHKIAKVERWVPKVEQPTATAPKRSEFWLAIYAAEFVRRIANEVSRHVLTDETIQRGIVEARDIADWHDEVLSKEKQ